MLATPPKLDATAARRLYSPNLGVHRAAQERARRDNYWLRPAVPIPPEKDLYVDTRFVLYKLTNVDTVAGSAFVKLSLFAVRSERLPRALLVKSRV